MKCPVSSFEENGPLLQAGPRPPTRGRCTLGTIGLGALLGALVSSAPAAAQTVGGQALAAQSTVSGLLGTTTTILADTGTLGDSTDARQASATDGSIPSVLTADTLHASTIGWPDQVDSEASLAGMTLTVAGTTIGADFVMSRATSVLGAAGSGTTSLSGLSIDGVPIAVSGDPNQSIPILGGQVVINEQQISGASTVVNALHVVVSGVADVVIASATAAVQ